MSLLLSLPINLLPWRAVKARSHPVRHFRFNDKGLTGPVRVHVIEADLNHSQIRVQVGLAKGEAARSSLVTQIARRNRALAAINGSFFHGTQVRAAVGVIMKNGELIADSGHRRTSLGIRADGTPMMGIPKLTSGLNYPDLGRFQRINGVNQPRQSQQTIVYTPRFGTYTRTNHWGREVVVEHGRVTRYSYGNTKIPRQGFVISAHGKGSEIQQLYPIGRRIEFSVQAQAPWDQAVTILTGAPRLVQKGQIYNSFFNERLSPTLMSPNARSAVGYTHNGKLLLVTVLPFQKSRGVTLTRLAHILRRLGACEAMALDGGGSTSLYVSQQGLNASRRVSNALMITLAH